MLFLSPEEWIERSILKAARYDQVMFEDFFRLAKRFCPGTTASDRRKIVLSVVRKLIESDVLRAGWPHPHGGFTAWTGSVEQIVQRIEREAGKSARANDGDGMVWFDLVDQSKKLPCKRRPPDKGMYEVFLEELVLRLAEDFPDAERDLDETPRNSRNYPYALGRVDAYSAMIAEIKRLASLHGLVIKDLNKL